MRYYRSHPRHVYYILAYLLHIGIFTTYWLRCWEQVTSTFCIYMGLLSCMHVSFLTCSLPFIYIGLFWHIHRSLLTYTYVSFDIYIRLFWHILAAFLGTGHIPVFDAYGWSLFMYARLFCFICRSASRATQVSFANLELSFADMQVSFEDM